MRLYAEIQRVLGPGGALVMDGQNRAVSLPHRQAKGVDRYRIYDVLYDAPELVHELEGAGFTVCRMGGIARHFGTQRQLNRCLHRVGMGCQWHGDSSDSPNNCLGEIHRRGWSSRRYQY